MPVLLLGAVIIAVLFWQLGRSSRQGPLGTSTRKCRWEATGHDTAALGEYRCKTCKVVAYAKPGKQPQECKRGLGGTL